MNDLVKKGKLKAPIVIGRDHLDCGSVASPYPRNRKHEGWQRRGGRLAAAQRSAQHRQRRVWVSIHNGGGVGIGYSLHAGQVTVADGTDDDGQAH